MNIFRNNYTMAISVTMLFKLFVLTIVFINTNASSVVNTESSDTIISTMISTTNDVARKLQTNTTTSIPTISPTILETLSPTVLETSPPTITAMPTAIETFPPTITALPTTSRMPSYIDICYICNDKKLFINKDIKPIELIALNGIYSSCIELEKNGLQKKFDSDLCGLIQTKATKDCTCIDSNNNVSKPTSNSFDNTNKQWIKQIIWSSSCCILLVIMLFY